MEFQVLGPLRVHSRDGDLDLGPPAQRELLAVLLTSPNVPVSDDRLTDELWGDDPPPSAHHLLQVYVSRLRGALGASSQDPRIVRDGAGYAIRVEPKELDAERFTAAVARGRALQRDDPEAAERALARAMRLWRGAPFGDLSEAPPAVRDEAEHLERAKLEAFESWIEVRLELGKHRELVPEISALVSQHPYDETLHADLMLALYRSGRQAEALEVAHALRDRLREDLGVDPSSEVRDLYHRILLQAPDLTLGPPEPPGNLPTRLTSFVGRAWELLEITGLLETRRLVTLTGPGGIGKTRLAMEVAQQLKSRFPGGTWWIDLAPVSDPETVVEEVAGALGVTGAPGTDLLEAIVRRLDRRPAMLVVDSCEHVAAAVADLGAEILRGASRSQILATSRVPLRIEGEQLWTVPPLSLPPDDAAPERMTESDAVRLFVERGHAVDPSFVVTAENAGAIREMCRRLDGLALAIEMAAARLCVLTPHEIVRRLDERFALLRSPATGDLARHRTLEAAFDASYALMSEHDRSVFERLSVFVGPFDLEAFAAVGPVERESSEQALASVTALVEASMLTTEPDGEQTRYRLLESLREYGAAHLRGHGGDEDARCAHAMYHLDLTERARDATNTPAFTAWMHRLANSYGELREALSWSLAHLDRGVTLRAVPALREFWFRRGDAREANRWTARMLDGDLSGVPGALLTEVHVAAAFAASLANDLPAAQSHAQEAVRLSRETGDPRAVDAGLWAQAHVALAAGDHGTVRRCATEALSACERRGDRWERAWPLSVLAMASLFSGSPQDARTRFEEALPLYREIDDPANLVLMTLTPLCLIAMRQGDLAAAERYATEAVELTSRTGWGAVGLVYYGEVLAQSGDLGSAEAFAQRALRMALDAGQENWFRIALRDLAWTAALSGSCDRAAVLLGASRHHMPSYGLDPMVYGPLEQRCRAALGDERFDRLAVQGEAIDHQHLMDLVESDDQAVGQPRLSTP